MATETLPRQATVLIIGAGPTGLAAAISLSKAGVKDILIVDALQAGDNTSRAMTVHAATLDCLDEVGCADLLVSEGIPAKSFSANDRADPKDPLVTADFTTLGKYTKFPFVLILPQHITERLLLEQLEKVHGVMVKRPYKMTELKNVDTFNGQTQVSFESGDIVSATYVIGADGAHSTVRQMANISYADPDGQAVDDVDLQMVFADIIFDQKLPVPHDRLSAFGSEHSVFGLLPLQPHFLHPDATETSSEAGQEALKKGDIVYRVGCKVPAFDGVPPSNPPIEYLQNLVDKYGPIWLSSDKDANSSGTPVKIAQVLWSTRFRNTSAIASKFFTRLERPEEHKDKRDETVKPKGGIILLVGDAAHKHSPAGGLGMNLGIRDAIGLGPAVAEHIKVSQLAEPPADEDKVLREYTDTRYAKAAQTIRLTKSILYVFSSVRSKRLVWLRNAIIRFVTSLTPVKRAIAWRVSGLGMK